MKKTNKCEICEKRYKLPEASEGMEMRQHLCFNCEFCLRFIDATIQVAKQQRDFKFTSKGYMQFKELKRSI